MNIDYVGTRWHKCDLHLHTPASLCFKDRSVTPEQWVQEALDKGLSCVAVTDHNTNAWIGKIQEAAKDTALTVFPGVEITCSDAKVHLLILFDRDKTEMDIYDFLILAGVGRSDFGLQEAHTNKSIEEIARLADEHGAIVIPAHVDEYNGICQVGNKILHDFLHLPMINAVQVVHRPFLMEETDYTEQQDRIQAHLADYYGRAVEANLVKTWRNAARSAAQTGKAILTFSDNPHEKGESKHGLWGMGRRYTWIKMEKEPSLEGLRQAFLAPEFRIRNDFECPESSVPYDLPAQWIEKISIRNTAITHPEEPLEVSFSPQLTTIIGGRGSGKSSILRFIRALFPGKVKELHALGDKSSVCQDFERFFKVSRPGVEEGVLQPGTTVELFFYRHNQQYKVVFEQKEKSEQMVATFRYDKSAGNFVEDNSEGLLDLFQFDIFAQKQIYDIGSRTNSLRNRIDNETPEIAKIKKELEALRNQYYEKCAALRTVESKVQDKEKLKTEVADLKGRLQALYKENELLKEREVFEKEEADLDSFVDDLTEVHRQVAGMIEGLELPIAEQLENAELTRLTSAAREAFQGVIGELNQKAADLLLIIQRFQEQVRQSEWAKKNAASQQRLAETKEKLVQEGFDLGDIEKVSAELKHKEALLEDIEKEELKLPGLRQEKTGIKDKFCKCRESLTEKRSSFLKTLLQGRNVRAKVAPYRDLDDFEAKLRKILGTDLYYSAFELIRKKLSKGKPSETYKKLIQDIYDYRRTEDRSYLEGIDGGLLNNIRNLNGQQLDDLDLLVPEDDIVIEYKTNDSSQFKPISNLSPGQKTASILTILLTQKNTPLILDQPEDDLDSFLIYDLIVEQLKRSKEFRQVIVVSHNANIPVNGDSEHIVVMDPESRLVQKMQEGSIDKKEIKEIVLKVMEGGKDAFDYRSKRYKISFSEQL